MASFGAVPPASELSPPEVEDNSTSMSLNVHVVPSWAEGQDDLRQSTISGASQQAPNGNPATEIDATAEDPFHFGGTGAFDLFLDDFFNPFSIGPGDGEPLPLAGLQSMPSATQ